MAALLRGFWGRSGFSDSFAGTATDLKSYWRIYGGLGTILHSPAFLLALLIVAFWQTVWRDNRWMELAFSILPDLLGFTIGALAIVLAFPSTKLFKIMAEGGREDSYYLETAARFVHFVFVQGFTLLLAIVAGPCPGKVFSFFGALSLVYSITVALMTALTFLGIAQIYNQSEPDDDSNNPDKKS